MISGRKLPHLTYEQYALDPTRGSFYDLSHLMNIKYHGDANIEQFLHTWNETVEGLSKPQPHDVLEAILWKQIESSVKMAQPLSRYRMAKQGSPKRSYKHLHGTLARYVKEDRNEKNHSELLAAKNGVKTARAMAGMDAERETPPTTGETTTSIAAPAANAPKSACYNFIKGTCTRGDKCAYSHDPKAELSKAERDRLDKAREKREKDLKGKLSKGPARTTPRLDAAGTGAPQARLLGAAGAPAPGRALLNGSPLAAPSTEPESSITSLYFSKEGSVVFSCGPVPVLTSRLSCPALLKLKAFSTSRSPLRLYF